MSRQFFYSAGNERRGPVSEEKLREMLLTGVVDERALVWTKELNTWKEATTVFPECRGMSKTITGVCPVCGYDIHLKQFQLGREMSCPLCRETVVIESEKQVEVLCPYCGTSLKPGAVVCRNCKKRVDPASVRFARGKAITSAAKNKLHSIAGLFKRWTSQSDEENDAEWLAMSGTDSPEAAGEFYYADKSGTPIGATWAQLPALLAQGVISSGTCIWNAEKYEWDRAADNVRMKHFF